MINLPNRQIVFLFLFQSSTSIISCKRGKWVSSRQRYQFPLCEVGRAFLIVPASIIMYPRASYEHNTTSRLIAWPLTNRSWRDGQKYILVERETFPGWKLFSLCVTIKLFRYWFSCEMGKKEKKKKKKKEKKKGVQITQGTNMRQGCQIVSTLINSKAKENFFSLEVI